MSKNVRIVQSFNSPKYIVARIERSRARHSPEMERAFLTDDVEKLTEQSRKLQTIN